MVKSDQAPETRAACKQLGCDFEGSLENRFPHNSVLERDIRTSEEIARACHLQAGFDLIPGLWTHSVEYAATIITAMHKPSGKDQTRHLLATGAEISGRKCCSEESSMLLQNLVCSVDIDMMQVQTRSKVFIRPRKGEEQGCQLCKSHCSPNGRTLC